MTYRNYAAWETSHGRPVPTMGQFAALPKEAFEPIYRAWYWSALSCDHLPAGIDLLAMEMGIMSGVGEAQIVVQRAAGVPQHGNIGPVTLAAVGKIPPLVLTRTIHDAYRAHVDSLPSAPLFARGWDRRIDDDLILAERWYAALPPPSFASV